MGGAPASPQNPGPDEATTFPLKHPPPPPDEPTCWEKGSPSPEAPSFSVTCVQCPPKPRGLITEINRSPWGSALNATRPWH